ncbi:NADH-dependent flavin oxidoreductase [Oceanobacillus zhaokaii]|uniref:NADH-dependent flavin oxidoreductase n=1 Tax=Oceanobacillus zhaokaii TaxID=2052660 RepID=A0A345PGV3_9BACI|nr:NADH-dependent flavin oxidoreductase [Oceanobacillus zhaokaii]AXI09233.1 NADH-dependent flavin oxidoreductase [Oceanobacillus zhaokaii]
MKNYLTPFTFGNGVELRNRFVMAPMTTYSANPDDTVSDEELAYYEKRSYGVGAVITACTYVIANGKGFPGQFAGHTDAYIDSLRKAAQAIHKGGAKAILQIYHGGSQSPRELVPNGDVVSASDIPMDNSAEGGSKARALTIEEIKEIIKAFGETTRRAIEAGFDGVEIHGANTYLLQQFFSGFTNKRTDKYGGTIEKRMRFPLEVVAEVNRVKQQYADDSFIVGYRFSPEEPEEEGITLDDTVQLVDRLANERLDYLHISLGDFRSLARRYKGEKENRIRILRRVIDGRVPLIGVGSIYSKQDALEAMETGAELLALGRELLIEPQWVEKIKAGEEIITEMDMTRDNVIPGPLMQMMQSRPGWVPGVK